MSSPLGRLVMATIPAALSRSRNPSTTVSGERRKGASGKGLKGMRLTFAGTWRSSATRACACAGESFTPSSITYSKVIFCFGFACAYRRQAASSSAMGYLRLIGTRRSRSASSGAWRETARLTGARRARRSMAGTTPAVLSVTRRRASP